MTRTVRLTSAMLAVVATGAVTSLTVGLLGAAYKPGKPALEPCAELANGLGPAMESRIAKTTSEPALWAVTGSISGATFAAALACTHDRQRLHAAYAALTESRTADDAIKALRDARALLRKP